MPVLAALTVCWLIVTVVAGSYPALVLSSFSPMLLIRKGKHKLLFELLFRRGLVVLQFACSVILIIAVVVISQQMKYVSEKSLGFIPESVLAINVNSIESNKQFMALKNSLQNIADVKGVSVVQDAPGKMTSLNSLEASDNPENKIPLFTCNAQYGVVGALGLQLLAGKDLPENIEKSDSNTYIVVNKKVIDFYGWKPEEAIGKAIDGWKDNTYISGVVADFNYASLHQPIGAYLYYESNEGGQSYNDILVKFSTDHFAKTMRQIEQAYKINVPSAPFDYQFLDEIIDRLYKADRVTAKISLLFSVLAILVSCLGLFGLTAYTAERRKKEIGIRKVLGASVINISGLLSADFLKLVLISVIVAIPVAILLMNNWLNDFAYHIQISWVVIVLASLSAMLIAYITVSIQAVKAAKVNPINSLKAE